MISSVIGRIGEAFDIGLWLQWLAELDRTFAFLLLLPFVVAVVGLWAAYRERDIGQEAAAPSGRERRTGRDRRVWSGSPLRE